MSVFARPTMNEARWLRFSALAGKWKRDGLIEADELTRIRAAPAPWRESSVRIILFLLTLLAVAALYFFFQEIGVPAGIVTSIIACSAAELMIRRGRFLHVGPEEALFLGGLFALILGLPGPSQVEGLLLFAAASFFAGWRVLNGLFVVAGFVFIAAYLGLRLESLLLAFLFCLAVTVFSGLIAKRFVTDPWINACAEWTVLVLPITSFFLVRTMENDPAGTRFQTYVAVLALLSALLIGSGLKTRARFILLSGLLLAAAVAIQLSLLLDARAEVLLIAGGGLLLAIAWSVTRWLRDRVTGLTARRVGALETPEITPFLAAPLLHTEPVEEPAAFEQKGGSFGGAGSSGSF
ncbi:MAG TPA: hypothetical protein VNM92_04940 [Thermoanaerobaculia bacterium]|nr:hypothetical protein [Thermoanaerobaculia bacterium]